MVALFPTHLSSKRGLALPTSQTTAPPPKPPTACFSSWVGTAGAPTTGIDNTQRELVPPQTRIKGAECWPLTGVIFLQPGEPSQALISSSLLPSPGPTAHQEESCVHILSQENSYPHTSPIVFNIERPLGRRQAVPLAGDTLEPGQGPTGAQGTGVVRATVAWTGARLGQLSAPLPRSRRLPAVAGRLVTQLREPGGCGFLLTSSPAQGLCTAPPVTRPTQSPILAPCSHLPLSGLCIGGPGQSSQGPVEGDQGKLGLAGWDSMAPQSRLARRGEGGETDTGDQRCRRWPVSPRDPLGLPTYSFHMPPHFCPRPTGWEA